MLDPATPSRTFADPIVLTHSGYLRSELVLCDNVEKVANVLLSPLVETVQSFVGRSGTVRDLTRFT